MGSEGKMISETQHVSMAAGESNTMKFALLDRKTQLVATTPSSTDLAGKIWQPAAVKPKLTAKRE
jgi:hypothetical protein